MKPYPNRHTKRIQQNVFTNINRKFLNAIVSFISVFMIAVMPAGLFAQGENSTENVMMTTIPTGTEPVIRLLPGKTKNPARTMQVDTTYFKVIIESLGAHVTSFVHKDPDNELKSEVELVYEDPFDFNLYLFNVGLKEDSQNVMRHTTYKITTAENENYIELRASGDFIAQTAKGNLPLRIEKVFRFHKYLHYWDFVWNVYNDSPTAMYLSELRFLPLNKIGPAPENDTAIEKRNFNVFYYQNGDFSTSSSIASSGGGFFCFGKSDKNWDKQEEPGNLEYFGMASRFMIMAVQPLSATKGIATVNIYVKERVEQHAMMGDLIVPAKSAAQHKFLVYSGPKVNRFMEVPPKYLKENPALSQVHENLYKAFDFGVTAPIRDLIVSILKMFYKLIPNYGVGIILFALFFKIIFFPLNQAQAKSMKKMQVLQPKIKEINEKYQNNPKEKQRRMMELYKKHKANPLGGCLPMVIQIPIFIALYSAFSNAYELWGSPFISGWINDLSKPDTFYTFAKELPVIGGAHINLLPIIMVASQFLQTKLTTVSSDKNQQMMMTFLPLIMLFFFYSMPSGVVLYWIVFNVFSVLQQVLTKGDKVAPQMGM